MSPAQTDSPADQPQSPPSQPSQPSETPASSPEPAQTSASSPEPAPTSQVSTENVEKAPAPRPRTERKYDPLKHWHYPMANDVDLVFLDDRSILTIPRIIGGLLVALVVGVGNQNKDTLIELFSTLTTAPLHVGLVLAAINIVVLAFVYSYFTKKPIYLVDFACYEPPPSMYIPSWGFPDLMKNSGFFSPELCEFQCKLLARTGLGDQTSFPPGILANPPSLSMENARIEFEAVFTGALDELFAKTGVKPSEIGILVTNCSLFNPTPSMSAMIIHKYKMKTGIQSYNLAGMGCSASVIAVRVASELLQVYPDTYALVFSTENITQNWYLGKETNMLVSNTLFRVGGAGILLTNKRNKAARSKYALIDTFRTHWGANDEAYESIYQLEDQEGFRGVRLTKNLLPIVEKGLTVNLTHLGPIVLPFDEQLIYVISLIKKKLGLTKTLYTPNFKKGIQHFCIHAGGRAIIDGLEKSLSLEERHVAPSRATLYRYGNTSSSSIWYELQYIERTGDLKSGDKIWQIALGSGFKCNSAVWKSLKTVKNLKKPAQ